MKKILIAAVMLPALVLSQSQKVSVDLRGRDCNGGSGICSAGTSQKSGNDIEASFSKISESSIALVLENQNLSLQDQKRIIGKGFSEVSAKENPVFHQEQDFWLDESLLKKLGVDSAFKYIKMGDYPMVFEEGKSIVIFTLSQK